MRHLALLLSLCLALPLSGSVFESLVEAETEFEFTVDDAPLEVFRQGITLRTVRETHRVKVKDGEDATNHTAYRAYHLEIAYPLEQVGRRNFATIEFYQGTELRHRMSLKGGSRTMKSSEPQRFEANYLAINLQGMPLTLLDDIDRINFERAD